MIVFRIALLTVILTESFCTSTVASDFVDRVGKYLGQQPLEDGAVLFAPGFISTNLYEHCAPSFSPDGDEVYWSCFPDLNGPEVIMVSRLIDMKWTRPEVAEFSGRYSDGGPWLSSDGTRLFFYSNRPVEFGEPQQPDADIWMIRKAENGWSTPEHLGMQVNSDEHDLSPCVTSDGTLYFTTYRNFEARKTEIYRSEFTNGNYSEALNLGEPVSTPGYDAYAYVGPDESFMILSMVLEDGYGLGDLYISLRNQDDEWSEPENLGPAVNTEYDDRFPGISPDGQYLFFVSDRPYTSNQIDTLGHGRGDIYWISTKFLMKFRQN